MNKNIIEDAFFIIRVLLFATIALIVCFFADNANADEKPLLKHEELCRQDEVYWYNTQYFSDGSTREVKVRKPVYLKTRDLVATNEHPVTWEYVYEVKRCDGSIISNSVYVAKTKRERAEIKLPPMPDIVTPAPGKSDVYGHVVKRAKASIKVEEEFVYKSMKKRDYIEKREIKNGVIINRFKSGKVVESPVKRLYTARVKSAPSVTNNTATAE